MTESEPNDLKKEIDDHIEKPKFNFLFLINRNYIKVNVIYVF